MNLLLNLDHVQGWSTKLHTSSDNMLVEVQAGSMWLSLGVVHAGGSSMAQQPMGNGQKQKAFAADGVVPDLFGPPAKRQRA